MKTYDCESYRITIGDLPFDSIMCDPKVRFGLEFIEVDSDKKRSRASFLWTALVANAGNTNLLIQIEGIIKEVLSKNGISCSFDESYGSDSTGWNYNGYIEMCSTLQQFCYDILRDKELLLAFIFDDQSHVSVK